MNPHTGQPASTPIEATHAPGAGRSPLIDVADLSAYGATRPAPSGHTEAELATLVDLVRRSSRRTVALATVSIGHSRDAASRASAHAFATAWSRYGEVIAVVDWPETAASWLRPATRLAAQAPDAWVIAATPVGFAQLARRLRQLSVWDPARAFGFATLQDPHLPALAGPETLHGLRGAAADGGTWHVRHRWVTTCQPAPRGTTTPRAAPEGRTR